ncbi:hypothetical protein IWQ60_004932 [Tieghemiomyces parasiticus]|uniref:Dolichyldiphosphatase n=1 Tax=Tieghemiomyces parasiticus TaxID=78921 RepID=A0A9W8DYP8_9FUNG|nr:hypothetical protein IWQ60_004932 [Tieghemiomyces parasiticus]
MPHTSTNAKQNPAVRAFSFLGALADMPRAETLTHLDLSHVQYTDQDHLGMVMSYATLAPLAIICAYGTWLASRRELSVILMGAGQIFNEIINTVLKRAISQARPTGFLGKGYGMPSSHAQFMAFFVVYAVLHLTHFRQNIWKHLLAVGLTLAGITVAYSRVYLGYHTSNQVLAGVAVGVILATLYFTFIRDVVRPSGFCRQVVTHPWAQYVYLRDPTESDPYLLEREYQWHMAQLDARLKRD